MAQYDFTVSGNQLRVDLVVTDGDFTPRGDSYLQPSFEMSSNKIKLYDFGVYKDTFLFESIGLIGLATATDLEDAFDKMNTLVENFNEGGEVVIADLISSDPSNAIEEGTDGKLYASASGGGGANITVVANYSALPDPTTVSGSFYWSSATQGTKWLPGSLGGTFYNKGMYYSNGTSWEHIDTPYNATLAEVIAGLDADKFVTPSTLSGWWTNILSGTISPADIATSSIAAAESITTDKNVIADLAITAGTTITAGGNIIGANLSGTNTGDQDISGIATNTTNISANTAAIAQKSYRLGYAQIHKNSALWGNASPSNFGGVGHTISGATSRTFADTNDFTRTQRMGILTTASTGTVGIKRQLVTYFSRNCGFNSVEIFGMSDNATLSGIRFYSGFSNLIGAQTNVEPDTLTDIIGVCRLSTSNNLHIIHNDNAGTATTIDLGVNFPANTASTDRYRVSKWATAGAASVFIKVERLGTIYSDTRELTTDLPSASTAMNQRAWITNNANASIVGFDYVNDDLEILI